MLKINRLSLFFSLLLTMVFAVACSDDNDNVQSEPLEEEPIVEDGEKEEPEKEEENSDEEMERTKNMGTGEKLREMEPVTFEQELWDTRKNKSYELYGEVGPIVRDGDLAIMPVLLDGLKRSIRANVEITYNRITLI